VAWQLRHGGTDLEPESWPPDLLPGLSPWITAFWELNTERQLGTSLGPIPVSKIRECSARYAQDDSILFLACIRAMDAELMAFDPEEQHEKLSPSSLSEMMNT